MLETVALVVAVCLAVYCWYIGPGQTVDLPRRMRRVAAAFDDWYNTKGKVTERKTAASRKPSVTTQAASASPAFNPQLPRRPSVPSPSFLKNTSFTSVLNRTADARFSGGGRRSGPMSPQSPAWASPRNRINPFIRSPDFSGPNIYQGPIATSTVIRSNVNPKRINEVPPAKEPVKFTLNPESTRNTGSPCTKKIAASSPIASPSCRPSQLHQPVKTRIPAFETKQAAKRPRDDVDTNPAENNPRVEKVMKMTNERTTKMSLKRPPLREETQTLNMMMPKKRVKGLNSIEASLTSSKRARERITSPEDRMSVSSKRTRKETLSNVVKILEASIMEKLSQHTTEEIMGRKPEGKATERERTPVTVGQVSQGTPKRLMKNFREKDGSNTQETTPKRVKKTTAKRSPSLSPEVPEWMKDKNSQEYKAEVKRHLRNKERDAELAKERLEAMLRAIDGDDEKETPPAVATTTAAPVMPLVSSLVATTSVAITAAPSTAPPALTIQTTSTTTPSGDKSKPSLTFPTTIAAKSPQASATGAKSKSPPQTSGLLSALKQVKSLTSPPGASSAKTSNFSPASAATSISSPLAAPASMSKTGAPQMPAGLSGLLSSSAASPTTSTQSHGFSLPGQVSNPLTQPSVRPAATSITGGTQQVSGLTFPASLSAPSGEKMPVQAFSFGGQPVATTPASGSDNKPPPPYSVAARTSAGKATPAQPSSPFTFGAQTSVSTANPTDAPQTSFRPAFGSPTKSEATSTRQATKPTAPQSAGFSFNAQSSAVPSSTGVVGGFSFGTQAPSSAGGTQAPSTAGSTQAQSSTAGGFSFKPATSTTNITPAAAVNPFGAAAPAATSSGGFSFGATTSASAAPSSGFSFNAVSAVATSALNLSTKTQTTQATGGFSFGATAKPSASMAASSGFGFGQTASTSGPAVAFGGQTAPTSTPAFGGQTAPTSTSAFGGLTAPTSTPAPAFGQTQTATAGFGQSTPAVGSVFGQTSSNSSSAFGQSSSSTPSAGSVFGGASKPASSAAAGASSPFTFGAQPPAASSTGSTGGFSFAATATSKPAAAPGGFSFQASAPSSNPFNAASTKTTASSGFSFNAAAASTAATPSSGFGFGAGGGAPSAATSSANQGFSFTAATATAKPSTGFGFGATTPAAAPAFGQATATPPAFGQTTTPAAPAFGQASTPAPAFGQSSPAPPAFGATVAPAFGQSTPSAPAFGQSSATPGFGSAPSTPGFGQSGAPAFGAAPSTPVFNVGTGGSAKPRSSIKARRRVQRK